MTLSPNPTRTFRDRLRLISPPWLRTGNAEKLLYSMAAEVDAAADALIAGVKSRFPNYYSAESLPLIGRERRIARGPLESDGSYGLRLMRWLDDHRRRGGAYALLAQLHAYWSPGAFPVDLVYRNGRRYRMDADGIVTRDFVTGFSPDHTPERWAQWYLFFWTSSFPAPTADQLAALALVPREWNAAHCFGRIYVMPSGAELWGYPPGHSWDESGTWDRVGPSAVIDIE